MTKAEDQTPPAFGVIAAIVASVTVVSSGATLVNLALPSIARTLALTASEVVWVVGAYQLVVVTTLLPFSALGERLGFRSVFRGGLLVYMVGVALACLANDLLILAVARGIQGLGASATLSVLGALVRQVYPHHMLGRGIAINAFTVAATYSIAPILGAMLLMLGPWQLLFAASVPLCLAALWATRVLPAIRSPTGAFDGVGALVTGLTFLCMVLGLGQLASSPVLAVALLGLAGIFLVLQIVRQRGRPAPLLPIDLLAIPRLAFAASISLVGFAAYASLLVTLPLFLIEKMAKGELETGTLIAVIPVATALSAIAVAQLIDRMRPELLGLCGTIVLALGSSMLALLPPVSGMLPIGLALAIAGVGFALFQTPNNRILVGGAPQDRSGSASGLQAMARELGFATGLSLLGVSFGLFTSAGPSVGLTLSAVLAACASLLGMLRLLKPRPRRDG